MPWNEENYPQSWKNFTAPARRKMIEMEENYSEERAVAIATEKGKEWAENRDQPVRKSGS